MRRRLATQLVVLAALTASGCGRDSPQKLSGVYQTRVNSEFQSGALNGVWRLRLDNGEYTFNYTGKSSKNVIISGRYMDTGRRITFKDHSAACSAKPGSGGCRFLECRNPATYTFTLTSNRLAFATVHDPNVDCELPVVLLSGEFHRVH